MQASDAHRHGRLLHHHPHGGAHRHLLAPWLSHPPEPTQPGAGAAQAGHHHHHDDHGHDHGHAAHGHSHGLTDPTIVRSHGGLRAVSLSLAVLGLTAAAQLAIYLASGSVALLADLVHNAGDALTAVPLGIAFYVRSGRAERSAGLAVVLAILVSATIALVETIERFLHPRTLDHLWLLAAAGVVGFVGNEFAAVVRLRAGRRLESPALVADGNHARIDGLVSLGVVASAALAAAGARLADPLIGLAITLVILKISRDSWQTVRHSRGAWDGPEAQGGEHHSHTPPAQ